MTTWSAVHADLLDIAADGLLCSANPQLNLSGGVGGAFALRYGPEMQSLLRVYLRERNIKHVPPGTTVVVPSCGSPFQAVAHAVAIDAFYDTNAELIYQTYCSAIDALAAVNCRTIVTACLGCGYGRCPEEEFLKSISRLIANPRENVDYITLATTNRFLADSLRLLIPDK